MTTNNLWFLVIFFGMSIASWLINQLREQAKLKKARDEARQQYEENLRTGRSANESRSVPTQVSTPTPYDLAERRQAQLRDLRKQQDAARSGTTVVVARPPSAPPTGVPRPGSTPIVLGPGGIVIQRGPAPARPKPVTVERRVPTEAARPAPAVDDPRIALQPRRLRERAERDEASQRAEAAELLSHPRGASARSATDREPPNTMEGARRGGQGLGVRALLFGSDGKSASRKDLRRLIALNEVLGKPVSMREAELG